jgi:hypothetical protein
MHKDVVLVLVLVLGNFATFANPAMASRGRSACDEFFTVFTI